LKRYTARVNPFNSSPDAQNEPTGSDKFAQVANNLPGAKPAATEQIAPDSQAAAGQMEAESELPPF
jgi:hypothetical protein